MALSTPCSGFTKRLQPNSVQQKSKRPVVFLDLSRQLRLEQWMTWDALSCKNYPAWIILVAYGTRYPLQTSHAKILFFLPLSIRPFASLAFAFSVSGAFRKSFDGVSEICHCHENKNWTIISANYCMALFPMNCQKVKTCGVAVTDQEQQILTAHSLQFPIPWNSRTDYVIWRVKVGNWRPNFWFQSPKGD